MVSSMVVDACFTARPSDIIIATLPKSGTTWIKSLLYATMGRKEHPPDAADHPFHSIALHECIKFLGCQLYTNNRIPDLQELPDPRLFATHVAFGVLPRSAMKIRCKVVYVCRDPKDTLISLWNFINRFRVRDGLETATKLFCDGLSPVGPYWDHVLGYWHAHLTHPEQVLFFRYEEMHRDPSGHVLSLAEFISRPFGVGEENDDVVEAIVMLCSFSHMSELHVNKEGKTELVVGAVENSSFFRRGMVGDWANHLSPKAEDGETDR
ncbi:unnamed protein product [Urochloa decumbens]|uniref:Sulfotransferase n=1 Tax=Urochloa decumbens TaxID=240449 RepID=A0ABC9ARD4_9POAL